MFRKTILSSTGMAAGDLIYEEKKLLGPDSATDPVPESQSIDQGDTGNRTPSPPAECVTHACYQTEPVATFEPATGDFWFDVGSRKSVHWKDEGKNYEGQVTKCDKRRNRVFVEYDVGDQDWVNLEEDEKPGAPYEQPCDALKLVRKDSRVPFGEQLRRSMRRPQ